jgi:DNA-binding CsgD family transcriptional regulator
LPSSSRALATPAPFRPEVSTRLSPRVTEVLHLVASGQTNAEIAARLGITARTVEQHLTSAYAVLGARGRADAVARAMASGVIHPFSTRHLP